MLAPSVPGIFSSSESIEESRIQRLLFHFYLKPGKTIREPSGETAGASISSFSGGDEMDSRKQFFGCGFLVEICEPVMQPQSRTMTAMNPWKKMASWQVWLRPERLAGTAICNPVQFLHQIVRILPSIIRIFCQTCFHNAIQRRRGKRLNLRNRGRFVF